MKAASILALLLLAGAAHAQDHTHGSGEAMMVIAHDAPPGGRVVVGHPAHFAAILFGTDGNPAFHQNMVLEAWLNGVLLYATTPESGHDYDGVNDLRIAFPVPGRYTIIARGEGSQEALASYEGEVVPAQGEVPATLALEAPDAATAGEPATFTYGIVDGAGALLPHTDALFEVRRLQDNMLVFRTHTHTHSTPMTLQYAFAMPGEHEVRILAYQAYPDEEAALFPAFEVAQRVMVAPGNPLAGLGAPAPPMANPNRNDVTMGQADEPYVILATYDPYTLVGPHSQARISTLVVHHETLEPLQHINFKATVVDGFGRTVFASETLHEYDGIYDVLLGGQVPGQYRVRVEAMTRDWSGTSEATYTVAPPLVALSAGPQFVEARGLDALAAGTPGEVVLFAGDAAMRPFMHSEMDIAVLPAREGAAPLLATKLHTHADGLFPFTLTLAEPGDYVLRVAPTSMEARPTPLYFGAGLGDALTFPFAVAEGVQLPVPDAAPIAPASTEPQRIPGPDAALMLAALGLLALAARRGA